MVVRVECAEILVMDEYCERTVVGFFALDSQFKIAIEKTWIANPNFWIMNYVIFKDL